jgi:hypothetical protein
MSHEPVPQARVGSVAPPADPQRAWRTAWYAAAAGCSAWMISVNPLVGGLFVATSAFWVATRRQAKKRWAVQWSADITELFRRLAARDLDGAEAMLRKRERIATNPAGRAILAWYRGQLCWARGDRTNALIANVDCTFLMPRMVKGFEGGYWDARFAVANLELELGQLDDAEASCRRAHEAPRTEMFAMAHCALETHHALVHDRPDELGGATQLAPRATLARARKQGLVMAVIAWAYEARGSLDTAASLREEARAMIAPARDRWRTLYPRAYARLAASVGLEP